MTQGGHEPLAQLPLHLELIQGRLHRLPLLLLTVEDARELLLGLLGGGDVEDEADILEALLIDEGRADQDPDGAAVLEDVALLIGGAAPLR